ncbi:MAG: methyl-accepting chemotaxis protein [Treponemataceae bacterium]|nr:methyl-accepting chemotaxis protein [Treponemataceae bacterium]
MSDKKKKGKLAVIIVIAIALIIEILNSILVTAATTLVRKELETNVRNEYVSYAEMVAKSCENDIETYFGYLDQYVKSDIAQTGDTALVKEWLLSRIDLRPDVISYVGYADKDGNSCNDLGGGSNISPRDYYQALKAGADRYIDNPTIARTSQRLIVHVTRAVHDRKTNQFIGLFYAVVELDQISSFLKDINLGTAGYAVLNATDGSLIGSSLGSTAPVLEDSELMKERYPESYETMWNAITSPKFVEGAITSGQGKKQLMYSIPIEGTTLKVTLILNQDVVYHSVTIIQKIMIYGVTLVALILVLLVAFILWSALRPLYNVETTIREIANGEADLTRRININVNNEIGRVVDSYNQFAEKLQAIVSTMKESKNELGNAGIMLKNSTSDTTDAIAQIINSIQDMSGSINTQTSSVNETAGAVNEIASNIESLNNMIENQVSAVTQASSAVEEMIGNIQGVNGSVQKMAQQFAELEQQSSLGVNKQNDVNLMIEEISTESESLQEANAVIQSIAEQTNLLAMNAAIEAAHAGEAGKGFSVVADEIRKLSEDSTAQSQSIGQQLTKITASIQNIVAASKEASDSFMNVSSGINATNNLVHEITSAMVEQQEGSKQISLALSDMNDSSNQVRTASFEMSEGNKAILNEIQNLQNSTFTMKDKMTEMNSGARKISETGNALDQIAGQMEESIRKIGAEVDQFKV